MTVLTSPRPKRARKPEQKRRPDPAMSNLASAGKAGSETAFLSAFKTIEWRSRPPEEFTLAIQHAL